MYPEVRLGSFNGIFPGKVSKTCSLTCMMPQLVLLIGWEADSLPSQIQGAGSLPVGRREVSI